MKKIYFLLLFITSALFAQYKPIELHKDYHHDKWQTMPRDQIKNFRAYVVSFDGPDVVDNIKYNGQPEWVSYEIKRFPGKQPKGPKRPSTWIRDAALKNSAPHDDTYRNSGYDRGHMCMKQIAWRLGENADWNTHTTLNACPQLHEFNAGIWLNLEERSMRIADRYGRAWIICGPAFKKNYTKVFIGDGKEMKIPVPDYFWKIIAIEPSPNKIEVEAYLFPHENIKTISKGKYNYTPYIVSVRKIEEITELNFFSSLDIEVQNKLETAISKQLPVK